MKMEQSVPKRRHIKFRRREITQKKYTTYRIRRKFEIKNNYLLIPEMETNSDKNIFLPSVDVILPEEYVG
jgi:hypothetical protein